MARLYRFVRLGDRFDTAVFTFIVPGSVGIDSAHRDVESKDFNYGGQKWGVSICRTDGHMGVYISLRGAVDGLAVTIDFSFTLCSREHFTKNETYTERGCQFTGLSPRHGRKNFVSTADLTNRGYLQDNGNYLLNVELRNTVTAYEQVLQLPSETSKSLQLGSANRHQKFETGYFSFGGFDWNCVLFPFGDVPERDGKPVLYVVRQTGLHHHCRVRYRVRLGQGDRAYQSDTIEHTLDTSGQGTPFLIPCKIYPLTAPKNKLPIALDLISCVAISECMLHPLNRNKNQVHVYDREKQAWLLEADTSLTNLKFRLFYTDAHNVPRRHVKYMLWSVSIVPRRGHYKPIRALHVPYSHFYTQMEVDVEGYDISTDIKVKETPGYGIKRASAPLQLERDHCEHSISNPASAILDREGRMTIHIEWIESHLLYNQLYNNLDSVDSRHKYQMAREILALQAENLSLEKQLHSYQLSIARNNSKGQLELGTELSLPGGPGGEQRSPDHRKSTRRERSRDRRKKGGDDRAYQYGDAYQDPYTTTDQYPDPYTSDKNYIDSYGGDVYGQTAPYQDDPYSSHYQDKGSHDYRQDGGYPDDYQYYGDAYPVDQSTAERYDYDPYPKKSHDPEYKSHDTDYTVDQYKNYQYSDRHHGYSPEKLPESVPYNYSYTEDYVASQLVDRRGSTRRNGSRRRENVQVDDGYFSAQSAMTAALAHTGPGSATQSGAQYLDTYPEESVERSPTAGRRSPSVRKHRTGGEADASRERRASRRHRDK